MPLFSRQPFDVELFSGSTRIGDELTPIYVTGSLSAQAAGVQDITGSDWTPTITGSVGITEAVEVLQGTDPWNISGSDWTPTVTGSVKIDNRVDTRLLSVTSSISFVTSSNSSSVTLINDNVSRSGLIIYNDTNKLLYVKLGVSASLNDFSIQLAADDMYELPFGYAGRVDVTSQAGGTPMEGVVRITELS